VTLTFTSPLLAEKPIRAVVNVRDDVVMEIDCGDGRIKTYDKYLARSFPSGCAPVPGAMSLAFILGLTLSRNSVYCEACSAASDQGERECR